MEKSTAFCKEKGVQGTTLMSMRFTELADGTGWDVIEVYKDAEAAEAYFRVFETFPDMEEMETVLGGWAETSVSNIIATKEERDKAPTIAAYFPEETAPNKYIEREPTFEDTKAPLFGWA